MHSWLCLYIPLTSRLLEIKESNMDPVDNTIFTSYCYYIALG